MTYIEFFDKTAAENVAACLRYQPDRVIFLGDSSKTMKRHIARYERVFARRGHPVEFLQQGLPANDPARAVQVLCELVERYEDCLFDITGGDELMIFAMGMVCAKYPEKHIQVHKFNLRNGSLYDCDMDGNVLAGPVPALTVEENIDIYGGTVVFGGVEEEKTYRWQLDEGLRADVEAIWDICREDIRGWNLQLAAFWAAEKVGRVRADGLTTVANREAVESYLLEHRVRSRRSDAILNRLLERGLLTVYDESNGEAVTIGYRDEQVKRCLSKAGQALEMKIFVTAAALTDQAGAPVYQDALNGVLIDWEGAAGTQREGDGPETANEIDVLLMHNMVPVFISCKNGVVTAQELYKLNTIAHRFGGKYAKKVLVATSVEMLGEGADYLRQRAADMDIRLLEDVQDMTREELERRLRTLWSN